MDKKKITIAFNRAAKNYDQYSILQKISGNILLSKINAQFNMKILDAGCGTGWFSKKWKNLGNVVTALDLSENMLNVAKKFNSAHHYLKADIEKLPLNNKIYDISWSNLSIQWCNKLSTAISELCRVTKTGGIVMFSTLGEGSLSELEYAWKFIDSNLHINKFLSLDKILKSCITGTKIINTTKITFSFQKVLAAITSIKKVGANHVINRIPIGLTKKKIDQLKYNWPCNKNGYLLSYQLIFGIIKL